MMVSTATAVLPVWRSPMISSRWPRPTGTMASIALRPVCTGCDTDWRAITPGATFSMTSVSLALIGPLPWIGWPSEFTTRPSSSGPIGTERILPVVLTVSPSVMWVYSPRITEPTESRSRFSARPKVFFGNSSISPCITSDRPWMRQMPSVTETTVPCVRICAPASRFWMRLLMSSEISEGFSCMRIPLRFQCGLERRKLRAHRTVDDLVAEQYPDAADEILVDSDLRPHLAARFLLQPLHQVLHLGLGELESGLHLGLDHALALVLQRLELLVDQRQELEALVVRQHAHEVLALGAEPAGEDGDEKPRDLVVAQVRVGCGALHALIARHQRKGSQHLGPLGERVVRLGQLECGFGIGTGDRAGFSHQSCRLIDSSKSECARASTSRRRIFSAPATASVATWPRSCSRAR